MKDTKVGRKKSDSKKNLKATKKMGKDPNKPKRPPTAYFVFLEEFREKYKRDNPNNKLASQVAKACGVKWKSMSDQDKAPYVAKAAQKKALYDSSLEEYRKKQEGGVASGSPEVSEVGLEESVGESASDVYSAVNFL
ncbi:HMG1/2-like protein isoform X2 [Amborella trichopoda]|uniref:HMG1/2-like protein isoform X2 n=1 Tax=Amborella trichopoda TaxID=13333 RepID=UPI0009C0B1E5|nr:HMG1/2-like protein isoform X2 [Amborella trichopoda]|eukprot:XP_020530532.1 HMG1/2-like protein isoform X2 [Amborella trichopoda]